MGVLWAVVAICTLQEGWSRNLYFTAMMSTDGGKSSVHSLDLSSNPVKHDVLIAYPSGPYLHDIAGTTGICFMNGFLYWGDQTTQTLHRAKLDGVEVSEHDDQYIANLTLPQGVACDTSTGRVFVVDMGEPPSFTTTILYRENDAAAMNLDITNKDQISRLRSITTVKGDLWAVADGGIFRGTIKSNSVTFESVVDGGTNLGVALDTESKVPRLFTTTYDLDGDGVLSAALKPSLQGLEAPLQLIAGSRSHLDKGKETLWSLTVDASTEQLFWIVLCAEMDRKHETNMFIMRENYGEKDQKLQVVFSAVLAAYGLTLGPATSKGQSILV